MRKLFKVGLSLLGITAIVSAIVVPTALLLNKPKYETVYGLTNGVVTKFEIEEGSLHLLTKTNATQKEVFTNGIELDGQNIKSAIESIPVYEYYNKDNEKIFNYDKVSKIYNFNFANQDYDIETDGIINRPLQLDFLAPRLNSEYALTSKAIFRDSGVEKDLIDVIFNQWVWSWGVSGDTGLQRVNTSDLFVDSEKPFKYQLAKATYKTTSGSSKGIVWIENKEV